MFQNIFKTQHSEKKEAQDIRDEIYSVIKKHIGKIVSDIVIQRIYVDLVLVFFSIIPSCICFPLETKDQVPLLLSDLKLKIPNFEYIYDSVLEITHMVPIVVFTKRHLKLVRESIITLKKLPITKNQKFKSIMAKMMGHICISEENPKYLQYRVLFSFTFNPKSQMSRPKDIKTEHIVCWCRELDGFTLKNLVKKLDEIETIFSVYGHIENVNKKQTTHHDVIPKIIRIPEYNVNLEIDMKEEKEHSKILKY